MSILYGMVPYIIEFLLQVFLILFIQHLVVNKRLYIKDIKKEIYLEFLNRSNDLLLHYDNFMEEIINCEDVDYFNQNIMSLRKKIRQLYLFYEANAYVLKLNQNAIKNFHTLVENLSDSKSNGSVQGVVEALIRCKDIPKEINNELYRSLGLKKSSNEKQ